VSRGVIIGVRTGDDRALVFTLLYGALPFIGLLLVASGLESRLLLDSRLLRGVAHAREKAAALCLQTPGDKFALPVKEDGGPAGARRSAFEGTVLGATLWQLLAKGFQLAVLAVALLAVVGTELHSSSIFLVLFAFTSCLAVSHVAAPQLAPWAGVGLGVVAPNVALMFDLTQPPDVLATNLDKVFEGRLASALFAACGGMWLGSYPSAHFPLKYKLLLALLAGSSFLFRAYVVDMRIGGNRALPFEMRFGFFPFVTLLSAGVIMESALATSAMRGVRK